MSTPDFRFQDSAIDFDCLRKDYENIVIKDGTAPDVSRLYIRTVTDPNGMQHLKLEKHSPWNLGDWWKRLTHKSEYTITDTSDTGKRLQNLHNAFQLAPTKESTSLTSKDVQPQEAGNIKLSPETLTDILTSIKMRKESGKSESQKEGIEALFSTILGTQKTRVTTPAGTATTLQAPPSDAKPQEVAKPVLPSKKQVEENLTEIRQKLGDQAVGTYALSQDKDDIRFNYTSKEGIVHVDFIAADPHAPADVFGCIAQIERGYVKNAMQDKPLGTFCQVLSDEKQYLYVTLLDESKEVEFSITENGLLEVDGKQFTSPEEYVEKLFNPHIKEIADSANLQDSVRPGRFCKSPEKENAFRIIDESGKVKEVEYTEGEAGTFVDTSGTEHTDRTAFLKASIKVEPQEIDVISLEIPHFSPLEVKINQLKTIESLDTAFRYNVPDEQLNDLFQPFIPTSDDYEKVDGKYTLKTPPPFLLRAGEAPGEFELITPRLTPPSDSIFSPITGAISWVASRIRSIGEAVGAIEKQETNPLTFQTIRVLENGKIEGENGKVFEANALGTLIYDAYTSRSDSETAAFNQSKADAFILKKDPKTNATIVSVRQQGKMTDFVVKKEREGLTLKQERKEAIAVEGELMTFLDSHFKVPHFGMHKKLLTAVEDFSEKGDSVHGLKRANTLLKPGYALSFPTYFTLSENATGTGLTLTKYPYSAASFGSGLSEEKYQINVLSSGKLNVVDAEGKLKESYSSIDAFRTTLNDPNSPSLKIKESRSDATVANIMKAKELAEKTESFEKSSSIAKTKMNESRALLGNTIENKCLVSEQANTNALVLTYWQKGKLQETKITVTDKGFSLPAGWIAGKQTFSSFEEVLTNLKIEPLNLNPDSSVSKDMTSRKALLAKLPPTSVDAATKELSTYQDILAAKSPVLYTLCIKTLNDGMQTPCINYVDNQGTLQSKTLSTEELAAATPENLEDSLVKLIGTEAKPLDELTKNSLKSEKKAYEETKKALSTDPGMASDLASLEKSIKANEGIQGYRFAAVDNRGNYRVQWTVTNPSGKSTLYTKNFSLTKTPGELTTDTGSHSTLIALIRNSSNPRLVLNASMPALPNEKLALTQRAKTTAVSSQTPAEQARNLQLNAENSYGRFEQFESSKQAIMNDPSACRTILEKLFVPDGNKSITDPSVLREMIAFRDTYPDKKDTLVALTKKADILPLLAAERKKMAPQTTTASPMELLPLSSIADPTRKLFSLFRDHRGIAETILAGNLSKDDSQVLLNRIFDKQPSENPESFRLKVLSALVDPDFKDYHDTLTKLIEKSDITPMTPEERKKIETDLYHLSQYETANEDLEAYYEELEAAQDEAGLKETTASKNPSKEEMDVTVKLIESKSPNTKVLWLASVLSQAEKAGKPYTKEQKQALITRTGTNTNIKMPTAWPQYLQRAGISNESQLRRIIQ